MSSIVVVLLLTLTMRMTECVNIETDRYYHIQGSDGLYLTVGGDNSRGVKIITEEARGSDPRQAFYVGSGDTHRISPQAQNALSSLTVGMESTGLVFQQLYYSGRHQWWMINDIGNNLWSLQNVRVGKCMSNENGKNNQTIGQICDKSALNQAWKMIPIAKKLLTENLHIVN